ncbi:MAG: phospholipase, partial [Gammaproteobacteria bacterium]
MIFLKKIELALAIALIAALSACAGTPAQPPCDANRLNIQDCPPANAVVDETVAKQQAQRRWHKPNELGFDPIEIGLKKEAPVQRAQMRIIGSSYDHSVRSLAAKIWLIDHAQHTVDAIYYIFKRDMVGYAVLGALCEAVQRGVDVRLMVDSLGSVNISHSEMKALSNCAIDGGFVKNAKGEVTTTKARAQVVVFNAVSKVFVNYNRRSHDKVLVIDGAYPTKAWAMTGGRNISLDYYGLSADGSPDPTAYKDMEILLRPAKGVGESAEESIGLLTEHYYSILFSHNRNKQLSSTLAYQGQRDKFKSELATLRGISDFDTAYREMPEYLADLKQGDARLAHELVNLTNVDVVNAYDSNRERNPNSIMGLLNSIEPGTGVIRIVSPYLFIGRYERTDGTVYKDGKDNLLTWLEKYPESRVEIVTNSVLTSDNPFAQSMIDMDTAPRLLLNKEQKKQWRDRKLANSEYNVELLTSPLWQQMVNNPQVKIYQTGRNDSVLLGGDTYYGKLHAKFVLLGEMGGFVGTSNFDYRSILYNNEVGYFFDSEPLAKDLLQEFETLKSQSLLWGTPEWLEMRKQLLSIGGSKA